MYMRNVLISVILLFMAFLLSSCISGLIQQVDYELNISPTPEFTNTSLARTELPTLTPTITNTPTPQINIYSPLDDIPLSDLQSIISNPFEMPHPRMDDGHQGVDLAFYRYGDRIGIEGLPIHAVLPGIVSAVVNDRNPYGNMIMVETPLEWLPDEWEMLIPYPALAPTVVSDGRLTCPDSGPSPTFDNSHRSLYIVYAHMQFTPQFQIGDQVSGNEILGTVGNTGHSSNAHLHLETRIGPANARFTTIAHKDGSATTEEMYNYCVWRVSNLFELFDPMQLLNLGE